MLDPWSPYEPASFKPSTNPPAQLPDVLSDLVIHSEHSFQRLPLFTPSREPAWRGCSCPGWWCLQCWYMCTPSSSNSNLPSWRLTVTGASGGISRLGTWGLLWSALPRMGGQWFLEGFYWKRKEKHTKEGKNSCLEVNYKTSVAHDQNL